MTSGDGIRVVCVWRLVLVTATNRMESHILEEAGRVSACE